MRDHPRSISIFGSCVTRDCFRGAYANQFSIENYIARESVVSAIAEPCPLRQEEMGAAAHPLDYDAASQHDVGNT